jgi:hypothetical protein
MPASFQLFISANPTSRNEREQWDIRSKKEAFARLSVPAFGVLIRRLYAGHELVVWSVEWLTQPVYARQERVMAMHNGTTEAPAGGLPFCDRKRS